MALAWPEMGHVAFRKARSGILPSQLVNLTGFTIKQIADHMLRRKSVDTKSSFVLRPCLY